jgi:hypothetical protein
METIDNRFPTLDEATNLAYVLQNYTPVWNNDYILLLKLRTPSPQDIRLSKISERTISFGEPVDLSGLGDSLLVMRVEIKQTLIGKLIKFIFQAPDITLHAKSGREFSYRFIPAMAKQGFVISPFLDNTSDIINLFQQRGQQVENVSFSKPDTLFKHYADVITVQLFKLE